MKFIRSLAFILAWFSIVTGSFADQSNLSAPTTGTLPGLPMVNDYNGAFNALATCNSGSSAPANTQSGSPVAGQCWLDTSTSKYKIKVFDGTSWLVKAVLDTSTHLYEPVIGGGTASVASASTTDLGAASEGFITITGTTTITGFGSTAPAGQVKFLKFASSGITVTYNATSLIIPGAQNLVTTAAGTTAIAVSLGSGNWQLITTGGSGGCTLLNTLTASNSANLQDTTSFLTGYRLYRIEFENLVPVSNNVSAKFRPQVSGTIQTSSVAVSANYVDNGGTGGSNATDGDLQSVFNNAAGGGLSGSLSVSNVVGTSNYKIFTGTYGGYTNALSNPHLNNISASLAYIGSQAAVTGFQFSFSGGNISTGKIYSLGCT